MNIQNLIIHQLAKKKGHTSDINLRETTIPTNAIVAKFLKEIREVYNKRSLKDHGIFDPDTDNYPYQTYLKSYLNNGNSFIDFTHRSMRTFQKEIDKETLATGGYIVFIHYSRSGTDYVMVVMLSDRMSYIIDENLSIRDTQNLNLEELAMANRVNIKRWNENNDTYLTFIKGKNRRDVSQYFANFIGCTNRTSAREATDKFIKVLKDYLRSKDMGYEERKMVENQAFTYCNEKRKKNEAVQLKYLSQHLFEEDHEEFMALASSEDYRVSSEFTVHHGKLKNLRYISHTWSDIKVSFPRNSRDYQYDPENKTLTFINLPGKLTSELENEQ